eukprot:COSAG06_NODE_19576_length_832_cov_0.907231_2_plen_33_part_01
MVVTRTYYPGIYYGGYYNHEYCDEDGATDVCQI